MKKEKVLQYANLSPSESSIEKLAEIHPMRQIVWASIIQGVVITFMLFSMLIINGVVN